MPATTTSGEQVLEAVVPGPDGANRLYTCTGAASVISINSVEADWDDESGKVEVHVEIHLGASGGPLMAVTQLRYWVAILAQIG
jgi:hypothetical protein